MELDAQNPRTKRGEKMEKEKNGARSQAKVWIMFFFLSVIFWISFRVQSEKETNSCKKDGTCDCLSMFDAIYTL